MYRQVGKSDSSRRVLPRMFCLFDMTGTPAITDSYGVSSLTDNGAGDITLNLTQGNKSPTASAYIFSGMSNSASTSAQAFVLSTSAPTAIALRVGGGGASNTSGIDLKLACVVMIGDH